MYRMGDQPHPRSQYNPHLQIPCSIFPQSMHRKDLLDRKTVPAWKCGNRSTCNWPDDCPTWAQPPQPTLTTKWQVHLCPEMPMSVLQKEDPPPTQVKPLPAELTILAVQACCASNTAKDTCIANMITISFFFLCRPGEHMVTLTTNPSSCQMFSSTRTTNLYLYSLPRCCTQQTF